MAKHKNVREADKLITKISLQEELLKIIASMDLPTHRKTILSPGNMKLLKNNLLKKNKGPKADRALEILEKLV